MGDEQGVDLPGFSAPASYDRFRAKARQFLKEHDDHITIHKLRTNEPLTAMDLAGLEHMLADSGLGSREDVQKAMQDSEGLGLFARSLVGLDREAAKNARGSFIAGKALRGNQIEFLNLVIDHLTEHGCMDAEALYSSPYTDFSPQGVDGVFTSVQVDELIALLDDVRQRASA